MRQHSPEEFLTLLERRTGLLIQSGHTRHNGQSLPVYEFRHLTIQEYLPAIAVVQGHYSNRDREKSLPQQVAELAGRVGPAGSGPPRKMPAVAENWREAVRLCVAGCNDDAVDDALRAIFTPLPGETDNALARTELAALCLADEPNVSETLAQEILCAFASSEGYDPFGDDFREAAGVELSRSRWHHGMLACLLQVFFQRDAVGRAMNGSLISTLVATTAPPDDGQFPTWLCGQAEVLRGGDEKAAALAALAIMHFAYKSRYCAIPRVITGLMARLEGSAPMAHAAVWALGWINEKKGAWHPKPGELERLIAIAARPECEPEAMFWFAHIFGNERSSQAVEVLLPCLQSDSERLRLSTVEELGKIGDVRAGDALLTLLADKHKVDDVWESTAEALGKIGDVRAVDALLALLADNQAGNDIPSATARALGKIGDARAGDALLALLADKQTDEDVWKATMAALGKLGGEKALAVVRKLLTDSNGGKRCTALGALSQNSRDLDALPHLSIRKPPLQRRKSCELPRN